MLQTILNYVFANPYLFVFVVGLIGFFGLGWAVTDETAIKYKIKAWQIASIFALAWVIFGGLLLVFIWSVLTISNFYGIPLLALIALVIVAIVGCAILIRVARRIVIKG